MYKFRDNHAICQRRNDSDIDNNDNCAIRVLSTEINAAFFAKFSFPGSTKVASLSGLPRQYRRKHQGFIHSSGMRLKAEQSRGWFCKTPTPSYSLISKHSLLTQQGQSVQPHHHHQPRFRSICKRKYSTKHFAGHGCGKSCSLSGSHVSHQLPAGTPFSASRPPSEKLPFPQVVPVHLLHGFSASSDNSWTPGDKNKEQDMELIEPVVHRDTTEFCARAC